MVNKNLLLGRMVSHGFTQVSLSKAIGVSKNTLNAKINGKRPFDSDEILLLCGVLKISDDTEKIRIFLSSSSQIRDDAFEQTGA